MNDKNIFYLDDEDNFRDDEQLLKQMRYYEKKDKLRKEAEELIERAIDEGHESLEEYIREDHEDYLDQNGLLVHDKECYEEENPISSRQ